MLRFEEFIEKSHDTNSVEELKQLYVKTIEAEGFENCVLTGVRGDKLGKIAWAELPTGYVEAYMHHRWDRIDPILAGSLRAIGPFQWQDAIRGATLQPQQIAFMEECRSLRVHSGIIFPFHGPNRRLEVMSISRRTAEASDPQRAAFLHAVTLQARCQYQELSNDDVFVDVDVRLTPRELEVLKWCKDGKSRPEIGDILFIAPKTVEFHLKGIMDKLGANNQMSAVIIALQRGLIDL